MSGRKIYIFRHNKYEASWSQFTEPCVFSDVYMFAEIVVLAESAEEAYTLAGRESGWSEEELRKITPRIIETGESRVVTKFVTG